MYVYVTWVMVPSAEEIASMIRPSAMRPVLDRRAMREASSSCFLRKRSRNDIQSLGVKNSSRHASADTALGNVSHFHDHAITTNPVIIISQNLVLARKSQVVIVKGQAAWWRIVGCKC